MTEEVHINGSYEVSLYDQLKRAVEVIGEESEESYGHEVLSAFVDGDISPDFELRGHHLHVEVDDTIERPDHD